MTQPRTDLLYDTNQVLDRMRPGYEHLPGGGNGSNTDGMPSGGGLKSGGGLTTGVRMGLTMGVRTGLQHARLSHSACLVSWAEAWQVCRDCS